MKLSENFFYTLREDLKDEESVSGNLLVKSGMFKKVGNGIYMKMPLGKKVAQNVEKIIREEMNNAGAKEVTMPMLLPVDLFEKSGRYAAFGPSIFKLNDRYDRPYVLGPTHEEFFALAASMKSHSYKDLPYTLYQIGNKYRDEVRPRLGLIRTREFTMKDAYSFHTSEESLNEEYDKFYHAYENIYRRVGIPETVAVASDTGMMGGNGAHEFMLLCDAGEDKIVICKDCGYSANMEVAYTSKYDISSSKEETLTKIHTPGIKTIEALHEFTGIDISKMGKAVIYTRLDTNEIIIVFIRADKEVNETKLRNFLKVDDEKLVPRKEEKEDNITYGFVGPKNLTKNAIVVFDKSLENEKSLVFGANEVDYHYTGLSIKRDIGDVEYIDVAKVCDDDYCPVCNKKSLKIEKGIEVGNIFKLGTKYTKMMQMTYADENEKINNPIMGCYGIGVGRLMASVLEKRGTESAVNWPASIAPFDIHICPIDYTKNEEVKVESDKLYSTLKEKGFDVLLDDRKKSAGVKFKDSDLIGAPIRVVISPRNLENKKAEVKISSEAEANIVDLKDLVSYVTNKHEELLEEVK